jgi:hypothetical protein
MSVLATLSIYYTDIILHIMTCVGSTVVARVSTNANITEHFTQLNRSKSPQKKHSEEESFSVKITSGPLFHRRPNDSEHAAVLKPVAIESESLKSRTKAWKFYYYITAST